jgi:hypothetical protein
MEMGGMSSVGGAVGGANGVSRTSGADKGDLGASKGAGNEGAWADKAMGDVMEKYDANENGDLDAPELKKLLADLQSMSKQQSGGGDKGAGGCQGGGNGGGASGPGGPSGGGEDEDPMALLARLLKQYAGEDGKLDEKEKQKLTDDLNSGKAAQSLGTESMATA